MEYKMIKGVEAFQLLLENAASVFDSKEECVESGILWPNTENFEAINWLNALTLWNYGYDHEHSPSIFYFMLSEYCLEGMAEGLSFFYPQVALQSKNVVIPDSVWHTNIGVLFDVHEGAVRGKEIGYKEHWGKVFKEPYFTHWDRGFNPEKYSDNFKPKPSVFQQWLKKD